MNMRFGLDPILGLIPGFGDAFSLIISFYLVWIAAQMNMPDEKIGKMIQNLLFDFFLGIIPFIGDIGDFFYKANSKNLQMINDFRKAMIIDAEIIK